MNVTFVKYSENGSPLGHISVKPKDKVHFKRKCGPMVSDNGA